MLSYAFSSNAFKKMDLFAAARQIAAAGYSGMEVMADIPHAYPPKFSAEQRKQFITLLAQLHLKVSNVNAFTLFAIGDTYHPTWLEDDAKLRQARIDHTLAAVELASQLGAPTVSLQPGGPTIGTGLTPEAAMERFADGLALVLPHARTRSIILAIEPEPGLLLQDAAEYLAFKQRHFPADHHIAMNCDVGHLFCVGDDPAEVISRMPQEIAHVHLEDIGKNHVHQHLPLGKGAMDIPGILRSLEQIGYRGFVTVELYPYVATASEVAREAMDFLRSLA